MVRNKYRYRRSQTGRGPVAAQSGVYCREPAPRSLGRLFLAGREWTNHVVGPDLPIFEFEPGGLVTLERIGSRVHPEDIPLLGDMIERAQRAGSDLEYEHRLIMPNQSVKYLHLVAHATQDQDGRLEYIGAVQDVTERRLAEEALTQARSDLAHVTRVTSLGVLTASIAHEVNQPLSGITNASTCLRMRAAPPQRGRGARNRQAHDS